MAYKFVDEQKIKRAIEKKQKTILKNSEKKVRQATKVDVGWFKESGKYSEQPDQPTVRYVATIHEFGLADQTEKAFVRGTIEERFPEWVAYVNSLVVGLKFHEVNFNKLTELLGYKIKKDLQERIRDINLIDTTRLINSILVKLRRNRR